MSVDPREFRRALAQFATGVTIVTAQPPGHRPIGMTVNAFSSVSLDPPLVLFNVSRTALGLPAMMQAGGYAVNVLGRDQRHLSDRFARRSSDKWNAVEFEPGLWDAPLLRDVIARFECGSHAHHDGGDHVIFVGRVLRFDIGSDAEPLVFFRSRYRDLRPADEPTHEWPLAIHY
jgi:flavin reductase (DIM6/NTAB) family NADH-FMN oxidoreductase RutF